MRELNSFSHSIWTSISIAATRCCRRTTSSASTVSTTNETTSSASTVSTTNDLHSTIVIDSFESCRRWKCWDSSLSWLTNDCSRSRLSRLNFVEISISKLCRRRNKNSTISWSRLFCKRCNIRSTRLRQFSLISCDELADARESHEVSQNVSSMTMSIARESNESIWILKSFELSVKLSFDQWRWCCERNCQSLHLELCVDWRSTTTCNNAFERTRYRSDSRRARLKIVCFSRLRLWCRKEDRETCESRVERDFKNQASVRHRREFDHRVIRSSCFWDFTKTRSTRRNEIRRSSTSTMKFSSLTFAQRSVKSLRFIVCDDSSFSWVSFSYRFCTLLRRVSTRSKVLFWAILCHRLMSVQARSLV